MSNRTVLLAAIASIGLAAASNVVNAAPFSPARGGFAAGHAGPNLGGARGLGQFGRLGGLGRPGHPGRPGALGPRSLRFGAAVGDRPKCGVWVCTWPLSGGGCLVWEKSLCKIKTIDPFN
jgi:hypothetical protein